MCSLRPGVVKQYKLLLGQLQDIEILRHTITVKTAPQVNLITQQGLMALWYINPYGAEFLKIY